MEKHIALVVEDDEDTNDLICLTLQTAGFDTISAYDGDDGLKKALEYSPDIIILDVMMPKLDGIGVCRALKSNAEKQLVPIIMITAKGRLCDKLVGYISGACRYITKPFDIDQLTGVVDTVLNQHIRELSNKKSPIAFDDRT